MADNNTYTSKQNVKKYTTQEKFDAIDKSDVPVGTEYNIVGSITESDLDSDLQAKVNLTGDGLTTEVTGGKVKVKNPMTSTGGDGFKLNSFYNATTGVTYFFPIETPIGHFATGIVPILGSIKANLPGSTSSGTYHGLFLQNAYTENNYGSDAFAMLTMSESHNSGNQIYILPYCSRNPGVSYLLNNESLIAGNGISIDSTGAGIGKLKISVDGSGGGGFPDVPGTEPYNLMASSGVAQWVLTDVAQAGELTRRWIQSEPPSRITGRVSLFRGWNPDTDGGSGTSAYILLLPTSNSTNVSVTLPAKSGTLATLDDIPTGGTTYTAGKNISISGTTIATTNSLTGLFTVKAQTLNLTNLIQIGTNDSPVDASGSYTIFEGHVHEIHSTESSQQESFFINLPSSENGTGYYSYLLPSGSGILTDDSSFKTLFGNQNIVGNGNIDLYQHTITILLNDGTKTAAIIVSKISSSNLQVDSLTDFKTLFGATFTYPCGGAVYNTDSAGTMTNATPAITISDSDVRYISGGTIASFTYASATTMQFVDQVKTV